MYNPIVPFYISIKTKVIICNLVCYDDAIVKIIPIVVNLFFRIRYSQPRTDRFFPFDETSFTQLKFLNFVFFYIMNK